MSTTPDGTDPNSPATTQPAETGQTPTGDPAAESSPYQIIAELELQKADLTDRLLRAHAEMDNLRKRVEREKADLAKFAISKFALDIVEVGDNFERAISAVPANAAEQDSTLKILLEGVTMTERAFVKALERHNVRRIAPAGEPFDPHLHQAVMEQENPSVPAGSVLQVFQAGYVIDDRVLRPAMVVVAKGGQKPAQKPAAEADAPASDPPASATPPGVEPGQEGST